MTEPILAARNVGKTFDRKQVLNDISASVAAGSVIGVLGKNGAGKTTLLEISLGFSPASSGSVALWGHESLTLPAPIKGRIGYVPQQDELIPLLTGTQQIALNAALHKSWDHELIARLAQEWEVPLDRRISALSGGERQKISLLLALGHRPELLVLDEPLASLDPIARRQFLRQLLEITADQTRAVIFSSHIISDLERVASEVWILREGRMAWQGELDALKESVVRLHCGRVTHCPRTSASPTPCTSRWMGIRRRSASAAGVRMPSRRSLRGWARRSKWSLSTSRIFSWRCIDEGRAARSAIAVHRAAGAALVVGRRRRPCWSRAICCQRNCASWA